MNTMKHTTMITLLGLISLMMACQADIRPDSLTEKIKPSANMEAKGRQLLTKAAQTHGVDAFNQVQTYEMVVKDEWVGLLGKMGNPWPSNTIHAKLAYRARSFDGRATFVGKENRGLVWGMQSWKTYAIEPGKTKPVFKSNDDARFILPAIQYLTEFIFRDHRNKIVAYAGKETINKVAYERVFITWSSLEPTSKHDQYMLYINPKTHQVDKIYYTVREFMDMATGTIHFQDVKRIGGVLFPFKQSITGEPSDSPEEYIHRITLKQVTLNTPSVESFTVNAKLKTIGDQKL